MSDTSSSDTGHWRTDNENDRILTGDTAIVVLDEDGERMAIDHASGMDGYVAFERRETGTDRVTPDGSGVTLQFMEAPAVECVYCKQRVAHVEIERHHINEHAMRRWNPAYYPDVFGSDEDRRSNQPVDTDTDRSDDEEGDR